MSQPVLHTYSVGFQNNAIDLFSISELVKNVPAAEWGGFKDLELLTPGFPWVFIECTENVARSIFALPTVSFVRSTVINMTSFVKK